MDIKRSISVELKPGDVQKIIIDYLKEKEGIEVNHVDFIVQDTADDRFYGSTSFYQVTKIVAKTK